MMNNLVLYNRNKITPFLSLRQNEQKLGEVLKFVELENFKGKFVLLGISEDIGPRANIGKGGANKTWQAFLSFFLNIQHNDFLDPADFLIWGEINTSDLNTATTDVNLLRKEVEKLDERVFNLILTIKKHHKIPLVIGGGHNNCYPIIKAVSQAKNKSINVLNIDPHSDLRPLEGRHSGNGFSYAIEENYLMKYFVLGLHESYNSQFILNRFKTNTNLKFISFDKMLKDNIAVVKACEKALEHLDSSEIGLEIDLDAIKNMPVSAKSPSGFSLEEIRKIIYLVIQQVKPEYIHICEGAPTNKEEILTVGKSIAYLVTDILKTATH